MLELDVLRVLLVALLAIAPVGTYRALICPSRFRHFAHGGAVVATTLGLFSSVPVLCVAWPLFTAGVFVEFLVHHARRLNVHSPSTYAKAVPFVFSIVAAGWLFGGANDLRILGYGPHFSYYAALHGTVVGWMVVGAFAILADRTHRRIYFVCIALCFVSFFLIAFGIDQLRWLKPLGVAGLTLAIPAGQLALVRDAENRRGRVLGVTSLIALLGTMALAWLNEASLLGSTQVGGVRVMVSIHGVLNAILVAPLLLLAANAHRGGTVRET